MESVSTIASLSRDLAEKKMSAVEIVEAQVSVMKKTEGSIHALTEILADDALIAAKASDARRASGNSLGSLDGIPVVVKDNICTTQGHTQAASNMLKGFKAPYDATVVTKLKEAGAVVIAKANCDEFAMGASTEYSAFGPTKNPWDTSRVPGGSSGGSAATIAAGQSVAALGTDTGGSIRHPASFCGVVGLRPTYGRVSRFGVIAYGSSLDQIGPITRTVEDAAMMMQVMAGVDRRDATTSEAEVPDYMSLLGKDVKGLTIGVPEEFFGEGVQEGVAATVREALAELEKRGAILKPISLPLTSAGVPVYYLLAKAEGSTNLARYDGLRFAGQDLSTQELVERYMEARGKGFGPEVKRTILMGTYALSAGYADDWYMQASKVRTLIRREYEAAFKDVDIIAGPTTVETAFEIGAKADDPLQMYLTDALVVLQPLAGVPAISIPCGFVDGLPVGLQFTAPHFAEDTLLQVAHAYEQSTDAWRQVPVLA